MDHNSREETLLLNHGLLHKGDIVLYEGKEAELINIEPVLIIKIDGRIICGALHPLIDLIKE